MHDPQQAQNEIVSDFSLFDNWLDRYQYLIDLGKKLEPLDDAEKTDDILLHGCQSRVWLIIEGNADEVKIRANSDAAIVSGLIALPYGFIQVPPPNRLSKLNRNLLPPSVCNNICQPHGPMACMRCCKPSIKPHGIIQKKSKWLQSD